MATQELTVAQVLRASIKLLEDPKHWTRGVNARDRFGRGVDPWDPTACQWCMEAAPEKVTGGPTVMAADAREVIRLALPEGQRVYIHDYNDARDRKHSDIIDTLWKAVNISEGRGNEWPQKN